jgi:small subunit ribosomal protein S16
VVTIRLSRFGRKKAPFYRVVAIDASKKRDGQVLEILGFWNPAKKDFKIEKEKYDKWVKTGAQVSATVKKLIEK